MLQYYPQQSAKCYEQQEAVRTAEAVFLNDSLYSVYPQRSWGDRVAASPKVENGVSAACDFYFICQRRNRTLICVSGEILLQKQKRYQLHIEQIFQE